MVTSPKQAMRLLGLDHRATLDDVRVARRRMAMKYHPDHSFDIVNSTRQMARINNAADILEQYVQRQTAFKRSWNRFNYKFFSPEQETRPKTAPVYRNDRRKSGPRPQSTGINQHTAPKGASVHSHETALKPMDPREKARIARIRFASQAYNKALHDIGTATFIPTIDTKALTFSKQA